MYPQPLQMAGSAALASTGTLRIMHVVNYLRRGGMEFGILKLMAGLGAEKFEHRFCTTRKFDEDFVRAYGLERMLDVAAGSGKGLQFPLFRLKKIFQHYRPHIVHTRNWGALEAVPAARLAGVPVVIHSEHGYEVDNLRGLPMRQRLFRKMAYGMTDVVFAVTRELRDYHARQSWTDPERLRVVYNGVDTDRFAPNAEAWARVRRDLGIAETTCLIGSVGRMVPIKDYGTLLRAADQLLTRGADLAVLLVGSGPELDSLQRQAGAIDSLRGRIRFLGASDQVPDVLNAMDVFVLPSLGEGMSNTILEAMASGLPVVVTDVGGNPEVVGERNSGLLFQPGDAAALAQALDILITNPEGRRVWGSLARERAVTKFSLRSMMEQYKELYLNAAKQRGVRLSGK
jgi:sugar transferase (PEP-CTERM/EpsH1 system associated)